MLTGNLLIIDTETTGLSPAKGDRCIEVAGMLYNVDHKAMLQCMSTLIYCHKNPVQDINGIDPIVTQQPMGEVSPIIFLENMVVHCDAIVAHNAKFDHGFLKTISHLNETFWEKPWICTKNDFRWPQHPPRLRLQDICESLDIPYKSAHRALADCRLLAECLSKVDDLKERIESVLKTKVNGES